MAPSAGYSGTPLASKLGVKPGHRVLLMGPPPQFLDDWLAPLPPGAAVLSSARGEVDVAVVFVTTRSALEQRFAAAQRVLAVDGGLWVAWPKKSSGVATEVDEGSVRDYGLAQGLVDNKVCAVTDVWSGLRFVVRLADRPGRSPSPRTRR